MSKQIQSNSENVPFTFNHKISLTNLLLIEKRMKIETSNEIISEV